MTEKFEDWLDESTKVVRGRTRAPLWQQLPEEALEEIQKVLAHNERSPHKSVSMNSMIRRIKDRYEPQFSRAAMQTYLQSIGRSGWAGE